MRVSPAPVMPPCIRSSRPSIRKITHIEKLRILGDIAPYSREYQKIHGRLGKHLKDNPELRAQYDQISEQVRQTKDSTLQVDERHFDAPVDTIEGTIKSASARGIQLNEYPGRTFQLSSVGSSMADLVADMLGASNAMKSPGPSPP